MRALNCTNAAARLRPTSVPSVGWAASVSALMLFSVLCFNAAVWRHLYPGPPPPVPDAARIHPTLLILMNAFLSVVSIAALIGIWSAPTPD
jgi:hypothetical protein